MPRSWSWRYENLAIRGTTYPDALSAAEALGCSVATIKLAVREGRLDTVGLKGGKVVMLDGITYSSITAAAKAKRCSRKAIREALRAGGPVAARRPTGKPVCINGVTYPSYKAAGEAHGVTGAAIACAVSRGTLHRVGTGRVGVEPMQVRMCGKTFETAKEAAAHFDVTVSAIYRAINDGEPDRVGRRPVYGKSIAKPVRLGPVSFPSHAQASRALGFKSSEYVSRVLRTGSKRGRERLIAAAMRYAAEQNQIKEEA